MNFQFKEVLVLCALFAAVSIAVLITVSYQYEIYNDYNEFRETKNEEAKQN